MKRPRQIKSSLDKKIMNNLSDKNILIIIMFTILFIFGLIFSVKSPERRIIESPIMWKNDYTQSSDINYLINNNNQKELI